MSTNTGLEKSTISIRESVAVVEPQYEADPLECPKCKGPMRVIALIDDPTVLRRTLEHLGRWAPEATEQGPPRGPPEWPANAVIPLTYHPVPDIA